MYSHTPHISPTSTYGILTPPPLQPRFDEGAILASCQHALSHALLPALWPAHGRGHPGPSPDLLGAAVFAVPVLVLEAVRGLEWGGTLLSSWFLGAVRGCAS